MSFIIEIPPELEELLLEEAKKAGMTPSEYVVQLVSERIDRAQNAREAHA